MQASEDLSAARLAAVHEHVRLENLGDLEAVVATFGADACYLDEPWGEQHVGEAGVRQHYERLIGALPDLRIEIRREHATESAVVLELTVSGTHLGSWRGVPATGRRLEFPACAIFTFDDEGNLAGERAYYDWASVLRQIGLFREPDTLLGRLSIFLAHPVTIARVLALALLRRSS